MRSETEKMMTDEELAKEVASIRNGGFEQGGDIIPVLQNAINYGDPWRAIFIAAIEEIKELRGALSIIADGDVSRQHVLIWNDDGQYSKHDKCPHGQWMYDDCEQCVSEFARDILNNRG